MRTRWSARHDSQVLLVVRKALHESLDAVDAREDEPVEGVEVADRRVERPEILGRTDLDGRELEDLRAELLQLRGELPGLGPRPGNHDATSEERAPLVPVEAGFAQGDHLPDYRYGGWGSGCLLLPL